MLCVLWEMKQLMRRSIVLNSKHFIKFPGKSCWILINRKSVLLLHDNPRPHIARVVKENIITLNIDVLPNPVTLLILLHLSSFSGHWNIILEGKLFIYYEDDKTDIVPLHRNLNNFYAWGIKNLPNRWDYVIDNERKYYMHWILKSKKHLFLFQIRQDILSILIMN